MLRAINGTVTRDVETEDALPLTLQAGDQVRVGQAHPDWPDYFWCDDGGLCAGWVPRAALQITGALGIAKIEYCSNHLNAKAGDPVRIMWKGDGFPSIWCENRDCDRGWIPFDALDIPPDQGVEKT